MRCVRRRRPPRARRRAPPPRPRPGARRPGPVRPTTAATVQCVACGREDGRDHVAVAFTRPNHHGCCDACDASPYCTFIDASTHNYVGSCCRDPASISAAQPAAAVGPPHLRHARLHHRDALQVRLWHARCRLLCVISLRSGCALLLLTACCLAYLVGAAGLPLPLSQRFRVYGRCHAQPLRDCQLGLE